MKTIALTLTLPLVLASSAVAQTSAGSTTTTTTQVQTRKTTAERIVMASGALVEIKGDQAARVNLDTLLPNGARITPGGTVTFADGTTASLRDGQMITTDGKISAAPLELVARASAALDAGTSGVVGSAPSAPTQTSGSTSVTIDAVPSSGADATPASSMGGGSTGQ